MHWDSWWHAGGMWLFWSGVFVVVSAAVYLAVRSMRQTEGPKESPEDLLRKRYASGEIDREEYERAMKDLRQF